MSTSIDQQFVEFVVKSLVSHPDSVVVERRIDEKGVLLELTVNPEDLGRVIGKRGATAQSLRTLLRALGTKNDARYNLKIIDNGVEGEGGDGGPSQPGSSPTSTDDTAVQNGKADDLVATNSAANASALSDELGIEHDSQPAAGPNDRLTQTRKELAEFDDLDV